MTDEPVQCQECGAELPSGAKFCAECGEAVAPDGTPTAEPSDGTEPTPDGESAAEDGSEAAVGRQAAEETAGSLQGRTVLNSLIGSVLGFIGAIVLVLSAGPLYFLGVMFGSGAAGWLQRRGAGSGALVGGVAGFVSTLLFAPFAVILLLLGLGQFVVTSVPLGSLPGLRGELPETQGLLTALIGIGAVVLVIAALINLIVGAVSGAVGGAIADG